MIIKKVFVFWARAYAAYFRQMDKTALSCVLYWDLFFIGVMATTIGPLLLLINGLWIYNQEPQSTICMLAAKWTLISGASFLIMLPLGYVAILCIGYYGEQCIRRIRGKLPILSL